MVHQSNSTYFSRKPRVSFLCSCTMVYNKKQGKYPQWDSGPQYCMLQFLTFRILAPVVESRPRIQFARHTPYAAYKEKKAAHNGIPKQILGREPHNTEDRDACNSAPFQSLCTSLNHPVELLQLRRKINWVRKMK